MQGPPRIPPKPMSRTGSHPHPTTHRQVHREIEQEDESAGEMMAREAKRLSLEANSSATKALLTLGEFSGVLRYLQESIDRILIALGNIEKALQENQKRIDGESALGLITASHILPQTDPKSILTSERAREIVKSFTNEKELEDVKTKYEKELEIAREKRKETHQWWMGIVAVIITTIVSIVIAYLLGRTGIKP